MIKRIIHAETPADARASAVSGSAYLAGGTEINRLGTSVCADTLIDIRHLKSLKQIEEAKEGVRIGSLATFEDVREHPLTPPWFRETVLFMASRTKRNMATIGGNIALMRDDSYLLPTLMASGARITFLGADGEHETNAADYLISKKPEDLILAVTLPADALVRQKRYANTKESHAYLTVAAAKTPEGIRLAAGIRGSGLRMLDEIAEEIVRSGETLTDDMLIQKLREDNGLPFHDDFTGSADYKRYLLAVTSLDLIRAVTNVSDDAKGGDPA